MTATTTPMIPAATSAMPCRSIFHTLLYGTLGRRSWPVNTLVYGSAMNDRLSKSDWIDHGLNTLTEQGPGGLKVGPMATRLKVSRGSFYWHFRDIADFRAALLHAWQERLTEQVIRNLDARRGESGLLR